MRKIYNWHKKYFARLQKSTGLSSYSISWISWFKGLVMGCLLVLFLSSCSNDIDQKNIESKKPISIKKNEKVTTYLLGDVSVKWDAFKHNSKVPVGGRFENIEVTNFNDSSDLYGAVNGTEFTIDVNSTKTGDTLRDYKIYTFFFGTMVNTDFISGKILSINKYKKGKAYIKMNGLSKEIDFDWDIGKNHRFILKTSINVFDWNANNSLNSLNEVCLEKHTGPDGVNVLWPNVDVTVIADLKPID